MSENKTTPSPEEIKLQEEMAKNKKSLEKAKSETESSKVVYLDAQKALTESKGDEKTEPEAKKALEVAKAAYVQKVEAEKQARIKYAQTGTYLPEEKEQGIFHVKMDKPAFDPKSGKKLSKEFIQKFTVADWNAFIKNCAGLGYTIEIMWNPENFKA